MAAREHDLAKFNKYVDCEKLVDNAFADVLVNPIETMPGLSDMGRRIALAALSVSMGAAERAILHDIQEHISRTPRISNAPSVYILTNYQNSEDLNSVLSSTREELSGQFDKHKQLALNRMQIFASSHPHGIVGRVFMMAFQKQQVNATDLVTEYGVLPRNFRGVAYCSTMDDGTGESSKTGLAFKSPKLEQNVILEVELSKRTGNWQIIRFSNLPTLFETLDPNYTDDFQALIQTSVAGMDSRSVSRDIGSITRRIGESTAFKRLIRNLKLN